ncbi:MAG: hypothetical protein O3C49_08720 [Proteobacteria bacterium]|nr:hypothetical protein [Pseudomonadota bacterium]
MAVTRYPNIADYNQAAQHPVRAFTDAELAAGTLATSKLGLPIVLGGGFALTYTVTSKIQKFAVRCFHRYVPDLEHRYAQISEAVCGLGSAHFVSFEYQREGVRVSSALYPVVKMAWAEGQTLGAFIEDNYSDGAAMRTLWSSFRDLAHFLAAREIAHGDLENGNLVVRNGGGLTLIDYDGMYVPGMALGNGNELGHAHFQHPGRTPDHFGPRIDDFSFIMIDLSLDAIARDPSLYERFCNGDNILFQKSDFEAPETSPVFKELRHIPPLADKIDDFATICKRPIEETPSLEDFLARHRKSAPVTAGPATRQARVRPKPEGISNIDYIRSTLTKTLPGPSQPAASRATAGRTMIPESNAKATGASTASEGADSRWSYWLTISVFALIIGFVVKSF